MLVFANAFRIQIRQKSHRSFLQGSHGRVYAGGILRAHFRSEWLSDLDAEVYEGKLRHRPRVGGLPFHVLDPRSRLCGGFDCGEHVGPHRQDPGRKGPPPAAGSRAFAGLAMHSDDGPVRQFRGGVRSPRGLRILQGVFRCGYLYRALRCD